MKQFRIFQPKVIKILSYVKDTNNLLHKLDA